MPRSTYRPSRTWSAVRRFWGEIACERFSRSDFPGPIFPHRKIGHSPQNPRRDYCDDSILGPFRDPPLPPRSSMGGFSTPPSYSDPPSLPPLSCACGLPPLRRSRSRSPAPSMSRPARARTPCPDHHPPSPAARTCAGVPKLLDKKSPIQGPRYLGPWESIPIASAVHVEASESQNSLSRSSPSQPCRKDVRRRAETP